MKKILASMGGVLLFVILLGAGCAEIETPETQEEIFGTKSANEEDVQVTVTNPEEEMMAEEEAEEDMEQVISTSDEFNLSAQLTGDGEVELKWNIPSNMEGGSIRIYRGPNENPGPTVNYWVNPGIDATEYTWKDLKPRVEYFRLCHWVQGSCAKFSENVMVEIE